MPTRQGGSFLKELQHITLLQLLAHHHLADGINASIA